MRRRWTEVQVTLRPLRKTRQIVVCDTGHDVATTLVGNVVAGWCLRRAGPGQEASAGDRTRASADNASMVNQKFTAQFGKRQCSRKDAKAQSNAKKTLGVLCVLASLRESERR